MSHPGPVIYIVKMFPRLSETFIVNEILELRRRGVDLRIVSLMQPTGKIQSEEALAMQAITFYSPQAVGVSGLRTILNDHLFVARRAPICYLRTLLLVARRFSRSAWKRFAQAGPVARFCVAEQASHLHGGFAHVPTSVAWWVSRLTGLSYSFAAHAKDLYLSDPKSLRRKMGAARFVWTCTESNGEYLRSICDATPVHVGYHGSDLTKYRPNGGPPKSSNNVRTILAVGRHVPKKGFNDLLRAAGLLRDRGVRFQINFVGDGPERATLESLAASLELNGRVRFLGGQSPHCVRQEYARADLVVLPSVILGNGDRDGIPNVLVEAMAMGIPVVSTRVSGIPELIRHRETGLLVPPGSPQDLANAIEETFRDQAAAAIRASAARCDVEERFDLHRNSSRLADLLDQHRRPTRCLYVSSDLGIPIRGHKGASAHVRQVAARFARTGLAVRIISPVAGPEPPDGNQVDLPIDEIAPPAWTSWLLQHARSDWAKGHAKELRRLLHNLPIGRHVTSLLREMQPDFVYERYSLNAYATGVACRKRGIPWLLEVNAPLAEEEELFRNLRWKWLTRFLERRILRSASHLFVVTHALRRWAIGLGVDPDRVTVVPNGVDIERFHDEVDPTHARKTWGWTNGETVLAFSGSLKPWHGGSDLLSAFRDARNHHPELRLVYIGDGPERKGLEKKVRSQGLEDVVCFTGAVPQDHVPSLLRGSDILVAPYLRQERFYFSPMKILEYLAVGRPVIASRIGEIPDWIDRTTGRLYAPGDRNELREAIVDLASDPDRREELGRAAANRARGEDWSDRVDTILEVVRSIRFGNRVARPRVAYVLKMFPRFSETFIINEIVELERQGVEIRVFSMKKPTGPRQEDANRVRAAVTVLPGTSSPSLLRAFGPHLRCVVRSPNRYFATLRFSLLRRDIRAIAKFIQAGVVADTCHRERIGHLHAHFASGPARVAKMSSMISGLPFSFTAHAKDLYWEGHQHQASHKLKKRVKLARFVVSVSQQNKDFIESLGFRVKEGRVRPIHIGLRLDDFPFRRPSDRPRSPRPLILAVGRLIEKKGFHILLEALAELKRREVPFRCVIAGEGPEQNRLSAMIEEYGLRYQVHLIGSVPLARLRGRYYSRARILAQPCVVASDGDRDGIPTVLLEAMALGVPVISTRVSGIPEAIMDGENGFLTDPGDVVGLANRIETILADPELADRFAEAGRRRVEEEFDVRFNAGALRKLFIRSLRGWPPLSAPSDTTEDPQVREEAEMTPARLGS